MYRNENITINETFISLVSLNGGSEWRVERLLVFGLFSLFEISS